MKLSVYFRLSLLAFNSCFCGDFTSQFLQMHGRQPSNNLPIFGMQNLMSVDNSMYPTINNRNVPNDAFAKVAEKYQFTQDLLDLNNSYEKPLDAVTNSYWSRLKIKNQQKKDQALKKVLVLLTGDPNYTALRLNIAAAVNGGANPTIKHHHYPPLVRALDFKDMALLTLLLRNGANVNVCTSIRGQDPIFDARTAPMAQLLLDHGATVHAKNYGDKDLLAQCMTFPAYESSLISLYKKHGLSPLHYDNCNYSALHTLALWAYEHSEEKSKEKAALLLEGLDCKQVIELILHKNHHRETAFDILINEGLTDLSNKALYDYLQKRLSDAQNEYDAQSEYTEEYVCPICTEQKVNVKTECTHLFCNVCLSQWLQRNNSCPICRKDNPGLFKIDK